MSDFVEFALVAVPLLAIWLWVAHKLFLPLEEYDALRKEWEERRE